MTRRGLIAAGVAVLIASAPAHASTFKPTRFDDPVPGKCKPKDCSLREAISAANKRDGRDKVVLGKGRYRIELPEGANDDNEDGDFDVDDEVTISGAGAKKTTVIGDGSSRVFGFYGFSKHSMSGLTVSRGRDHFGGGIFVGPSPLSLRDVFLKANNADSGAGLYSVSPRLTITDSTFKSNLADLGGGGLVIPAGFVAKPKATIKSSTIDNNRAPIGGGLYVDGTNAGGADEDPAVKIVNSTIYSNAAESSGGGAAAVAGATLNLDNSTVANNTADFDNSVGGMGGGIYQAGGASFGFADSILDLNDVGSTGTDPSCSGTFTGAGNALQGMAMCGTTGTGSLEPIVKGLDSNGGPTKTAALSKESVAKGLALSCPKNDQRGEKRPANCDAGAFEDNPK